jgi:hypothetical protein
MVKAERGEAQANKEKKLLEDALQQEATRRIAAEQAAARAQREAAAAAAAAVAAESLIADAALRKSSMVHSSVQQRVESVDVSISADTIAAELKATAAAEAAVRSSLAALRREFEANEVIIMSLQEQLRERDRRVRPCLSAWANCNGTVRPVRA